MSQDEGQGAGKTPGEQAREGVDASGLAGPERDDARSIGKGGAPTGPGDSAAETAPDSTDEDAQLLEQIIDTARRMAEDNPNDQVSGEEIAREAGLEPDNPAVEKALKLGSERGDLACQGWRADGGLPTRVHAGVQPNTANQR